MSWPFDPNDPLGRLDLTNRDPLLEGHEHFGASELDVECEANSFFQYGEPISLMHAIGMVHGDLHYGNLLFDARNGRPIILDFAKTLGHALDPYAMSRDFIIPMTSFSRAQFHALLAGYVRAALIRLDPLQEDYTHRFLHAIGGRADHLVALRPAPLWVPTVLSTCDARLRQGPHDLHLEPSASQPRSSPGEVDERPLLALYVAALICGFDCTAYFARVAPPLRGGAATIHQMFAASLKGQSTTAAVATNGAHSLALSLCAHLRRNSSLDRFDRKTSLLQALVRETASYPAEQRAEWIDLIVDACDHFALWPSNHRSASDNHGAISINQTSLMLAELVLDGSRQDESRCVTAFQRHHFLADCHLLYSKERLAVKDLIVHCARATALCNLLVSGFSRSVEAVLSGRHTGALWSFLWQALELNRAMLRQCGMACDDRYLDGHQAFHRSIFQLVARHQLRFLGLHMRACTALRDMAQLRTVWLADRGAKSKGEREHDWLSRLLDTLATVERTEEVAKVAAEGHELLQ